jgi:hypothetical protein
LLATRLFAGFSAQLETFGLTTENRGVPGSSPGLAIRNPAFQPDFLLFGPVTLNRDWALDWAPGPILWLRCSGPEPQSWRGFLSRVRDQRNTTPARGLSRSTPRRQALALGDRRTQIDDTPRGARFGRHTVTTDAMPKFSARVRGVENIGISAVSSRVSCRGASDDERRRFSERLPWRGPARGVQARHVDGANCRTPLSRSPTRTVGWC